MKVKESKTPLSGEAFTPASLWSSLNWNEIEATVNALQKRIARSSAQKNWRKVHQLSYLLTHSLSAKLLSVKIVTSNKGKRTPGIDNQVWVTAEEKYAAALSLTNKGYHSLPLKRKYIPKKNGKTRPLSIPTMHDRAIQTLYALARAPVEFSTGDTTSFGFRKGRSARDASTYLFSCLSRSGSAQWIVEGDIQACFDEINHAWLLENVPMDKHVLKQFLKAGFMEGYQLFPTVKGTPQGGTISPILANITLNGLETMLLQAYNRRPKSGKITKSYNPHKVNLARYADDFVITADSPETAEDIVRRVANFLRERGLILSSEKTHITHIDEGFDFLGWNFRKYSGKLLIKPAKEARERITEKLRLTLRQTIASPQRELIRQLNPIIAGWTAYHRHTVASQIFHLLDNTLYGMMRKWAKKRHPKKTPHWTLNRYWHPLNKRKYVFCDGETVLRQFSDTKIRRYSLVKLGMNPYIDTAYFQGRKAMRC